MRRRLARGAAIVAATTAIGLALSASPAAAMTNCQYWQLQSNRAASWMSYYQDYDYLAWSVFYDWWLHAEIQLEAHGC